MNQKSLTLTVAEIRDLAEIAGFSLSGVETDADEQETEITICTCPEKGLDDEGTPRFYRYVAFDTEYPEEGSSGLGLEITKEMA